MGTEQAAPSIFYSPLIPFIFISLVFYFLVLKPQKSKQKQREAMLKDLTKNDEVITAAGIHGTIALVKDKTVVVRVDDQTKIEFDKEAIVSIKNPKDK